MPDNPMDSVLIVARELVAEIINSPEYAPVLIAAISLPAVIFALAAFWKYTRRY